MVLYMVVYPKQKGQNLMPVQARASLLRFKNASGEKVAYKKSGLTKRGVHGDYLSKRHAGQHQVPRVRAHICQKKTWTCSFSLQITLAGIPKNDINDINIYTKTHIIYLPLSFQPGHAVHDVPQTCGQR